MSDPISPRDVVHGAWWAALVALLAAAYFAARWRLVERPRHIPRDRHHAMANAMPTVLARMRTRLDG